MSHGDGVLVDVERHRNTSQEFSPAAGAEAADTRGSVERQSPTRRSDPVPLATAFHAAEPAGAGSDGRAELSGSVYAEIWRALELEAERQQRDAEQAS